ncbi:MAG TPA: hypothetical protein VJ436_08890 [Anaerolineales bacterium]|nr:hypothetical protein [Anaerolineales bacterium]
MGEFEEEYLDVLQNIESTLARVYREDPKMSDYDALKAVQAVTRAYSNEAAARPARETQLNGPALQSYQNVHAICEWRLGRQSILNEKDHPAKFEIEPLTLDEIIACLKRVQRSVEKWNKRGGRRGYFEFVSQFLP